MRKRRFAIQAAFGTRKPIVWAVAAWLRSAVGKSSSSATHRAPDLTAPVPRRSSPSACPQTALAPLCGYALPGFPRRLPGQSFRAHAIRLGGTNLVRLGARQVVPLRLPTIRETGWLRVRAPLPRPKSDFRSLAQIWLESRFARRSDLPGPTATRDRFARKEPGRAGAGEKGE